MNAIDPKQEFRELLASSGWNQARAARELAITPSALSQIVRENSPVRPSAGTLQMFKLVLQLKNSEAFKPEPARTPAPLSWTELSSWERDLIETLRAIPPKRRELLLTAFRAMIEAGSPGKGSQRL